MAEFDTRSTIFRVILRHVSLSSDSTISSLRNLMAKIFLAVGTVTNTATAVARVCSNKLTNAGHDVVLDEEASVASLNNSVADAVLVVTATTGRGDIPNNLLSPCVTKERIMTCAVINFVEDS